MSEPTPQHEEQIATPDDQKTLEWIAVLAAADLDYRLTCDEEQWRLHVPRAQHAAALAQIEAYEADYRAWPSPDRRTMPARKPTPHTDAAVWGVGFLLAFYAWFGPYDSGNPALRAGCADSEAMLNGEWWRAVTALTLHSGFPHVASNALSLLFLGHAVCGLFGGGWGWLLMLGAGIAGNIAEALLIRTDHLGVGASTASFGAVGILAVCQALEMLRRWGEWRSVWSRVWVPLGAGLALLALLGAGPKSDLAAHALGLAFGGLFALPLCAARAPIPPPRTQRLLALLCALSVLCAWAAALRHLAA